MGGAVVRAERWRGRAGGDAAADAWVPGAVPEVGDAGVAPRGAGAMSSSPGPGVARGTTALSSPVLRSVGAGPGGALDSGGPVGTGARVLVGEAG